MTSTVIIQAHCSEDKEVVVEKLENGDLVSEVVLQNGESGTYHIYDSIQIITFERDK